MGSYTMLASKIRGTPTIAVEPHPDTARALRRNIEVNAIGDRVGVAEAALGAMEGTCPSPCCGTPSTASRARRTGETRQVPLKTLDGILGGEVPTIIKIDVEGFEAEVFRGAARTPGDPRLRAIITEAQDADVLGMLQAAGFARGYYDPESKKARLRKVNAISQNALLLR